MPIAKVNGIDIFYEVHGRGERLVIVPGITCDYTWADPIIATLQKHFEILLFDNRGVGMSSAPDSEYTVDEMAEDTMGLINHLGWDRPYILGSSMGGAIVQRVLSKYPENFSKAILSTTASHFLEPTLLIFQQIERLYSLRAPREMIATQLIAISMSHHYLHTQGYLDEAIDGLINHPHFQSPTGYRGQLNALKKFDSRKWLDKISTPTLVIGTQWDICTPVEQSYELHRGIEGSQIVIVPSSAHALVTEQPKALAEQIVEFFVNETPTVKSIAI